MKVELKVVGGTRTGQTIPIAIPQFMIGRADDCQLKPRSELISRYHCAILTDGDYVAVRDLGSKNGVYVDGERVATEQELKNGNRLAIGPLEFEVILTTATAAPKPAPAPAPEPKVDPLAAVVARAVEQSSLAEATRRQTEQAAQPIYPIAASTPTPTPQPTQPAPALAHPVEPAPVATPKPAPTPVDAASLFTAAPIAGASKSSDSDDEDELSDWLLGDDDDSNEETRTLSIDEELDLPYTPKPSEDEATPEQKPEARKESKIPNSSDSAANALKNFFKGGR